MKRFGLLAVGALAVAFCLFMSACDLTTPVVDSNEGTNASTNASANAGQSSRTLTVNASAEIKVVPDKAGFTIEVVANGKTAQEAQAAAKDPVKNVIDALQDEGVDEKNMQTTYTGVSPVYAGTLDTSEERVSGYESRTIIEVSEVDVESVAVMMQACLDAGATGVNGPTYAASVYDEAYQEALTKAIGASRTKAEVMAEATNATLGPAVSLVEGYENTMYRTSGANVEKSNMAYDDAGGIAIEPGELTIRAEVTVTYAIS